VSAHHSAAAEFDANKPLKVTGVVTKIDWVNPHTIFYMDVAGDSGKAVNWGWELPSPNELTRNGWTRTSMKIGDMITVEGTHARDGSNHGMARSVTLTGTGKRLFAGNAPGQEP
jgi:hypothetical protein